jgi:hypothetical protein
MILLVMFAWLIMKGISIYMWIVNLFIRIKLWFADKKINHQLKNL